jgi:hypothetical protein
MLHVSCIQERRTAAHELVCCVITASLAACHANFVSLALHQAVSKPALRQKATRLQSSAQPAAASMVDRSRSQWRFSLLACITIRILGEACLSLAWQHPVSRGTTSLYRQGQQRRALPAAAQSLSVHDEGQLACHLAVHGRGSRTCMLAARVRLT